MVLVFSLILNGMMIMMCLNWKAVNMALMAYMRIHRIQEPSEAEIKILLAQAWRQLFRGER